MSKSWRYLQNIWFVLACHLTIIALTYFLTAIFKEGDPVIVSKALPLFPCPSWIFFNWCNCTFRYIFILVAISKKYSIDDCESDTSTSVLSTLPALTRSSLTLTTASEISFPFWKIPLLLLLFLPLLLLVATRDPADCWGALVRGVVPQQRYLPSGLQGRRVVRTDG